MSKNDVDMPNAPWSTASPRIRVSSASSAAEASRSHASSPITYMRRTEWPIIGAACTPRPPSPRAATYSGYVSQPHGMPSSKLIRGMSSM